MSETAGVILKGIGGLYTVYENGTLYSCSARGIFRKDGETLLTGDRVILRDRDFGKMSAVISEICPRRNSLLRPRVANVDKLILVIAAGNPKPDLYLVDKMLIMAERNEITPVLVINKADQDEGYAKDLAEGYGSAIR